jgi:phosphoglycolate/pyridoxal phosphate phosphatase family enzyme
MKEVGSVPDGPFQAGTLSQHFDGLMCDLDGVVYRGERVLDGAPQAVTRLRDRGVHILFCTNNSRSPVGEYVQRLQLLGIAASEQELLTSATVTAAILKERGYGGKRAIVIGDVGVRDTVTGIGMELNDDPLSTAADVVVVGWDLEFTFDVMRRASTSVREGAALIATNDDSTFPAPDGLWPGAGAIVASIEVASGRKAEVIGKPHEPMMRVAAKRLQDMGATSVAAVGDRPDSDLAGARSLGWGTVLVLSGVTDAVTAESLEPRPDLIVPDLGALG